MTKEKFVRLENIKDCFVARTRKEQYWIDRAHGNIQIHGKFCVPVAIVGKSVYGFRLKGDEIYFDYEHNNPPGKRRVVVGNIDKSWTDEELFVRAWLQEVNEIYRKKNRRG